MASTEWKYHRFDLVDSTNTVAAGFVRERLAVDARAEVDRNVFVARVQSAGRGQYERGFASPEGGLYFTAVLDGIEDVMRPPLPLLAGLAVVHGLDGASGPYDIRIRWPNDLVIKGEKIGGILCEGIAMGGRWVALVGIGINVNSDTRKLPAHAGSLFEYDGMERDLDGMLGRLLERLAIIPRMVNWREQFKTVDALCGKRVMVMVDGERIEGVASGVNELGALVVEGDEGVRVVGRGSVMEVEGVRIKG